MISDYFPPERRATALGVFSLGVPLGILIGFARIAPASVLTAPLGARIAHGFSARRLSLLFGAFLIVAAARLFYRALL